MNESYAPEINNNILAASRYTKVRHKLPLWQEVGHFGVKLGVKLKFQWNETERTFLK